MLQLGQEAFDGFVQDACSEHQVADGDSFVYAVDGFLHFAV